MERIITDCLAGKHHPYENKRALLLGGNTLWLLIPLVMKKMEGRAQQYYERVLEAKMRAAVPVWSAASARRFVFFRKQSGDKSPHSKGRVATC